MEHLDWDDDEPLTLMYRLFWGKLNQRSEVNEYARWFQSRFGPSVTVRELSVEEVRACVVP